MIDRSPLFSVYSGDPVIAKVLPIFLQHLPGHLELVRRSVAERDWLAAASLCHRLKGTSGGYGYPQLAERLAELEDALRLDLPNLDVIAITLVRVADLEKRILLAGSVVA